MSKHGKAVILSFPWEEQESFVLTVSKGKFLMNYLISSLTPNEKYFLCLLAKRAKKDDTTNIDLWFKSYVVMGENEGWVCLICNKVIKSELGPAWSETH